MGLFMDLVKGEKGRDFYFDEEITLPSSRCGSGETTISQVQPGSEIVLINICSLCKFIQSSNAGYLATATGY